jgi:two-component system sensor kinase FixL
MPANLFEQFKDLQVYVGWTEEDAARVRSAAEVIEKNMDALIDDFYAEIQRHPEASRVLSGGQAQIARLTASLRTWLSETMQCRSDAGYVERRWNIGLRHVKVGLERAYTSVAMARLRNGITKILADTFGDSPSQFCQLVDSFTKLFDLELTIIQNAYQAESLKVEKLAEHERSEVRFKMLVEAAACMVVILRPDETIAYFSPYSEELTGYRAAEAVGRSFPQQFVPEATQFDVSTAIAQTFSGRSTIAYEMPILHRDGSQRWFVWNARRLDDFEGEPAVLVVGQDFTERREAQVKLMRSERLAGIGQMITGIAHESRNALQRIQSCTEMLELEIENNNEAQRLVRRLQEAQDNLVRLFDEVRNFAAPIQLEAEKCKLDSIWREAWDSLETMRRDRDATLVEKSCDFDFNVSVDRFRIVQIFRNLLENSLAACSDPVLIQIECRDAHVNGRPTIELRIRDNGPGLTPKARQSVFEPFFTTKTKGTGLGMAIARRIIEAHGGHIAVGDESSSGAEFVITFLRATP